MLADSLCCKSQSSQAEKFADQAVYERGPRGLNKQVYAAMFIKIPCHNGHLQCEWATFYDCSCIIESKTKEKSGCFFLSANISLAPWNKNEVIEATDCCLLSVLSQQDAIYLVHG